MNLPTRILGACPEEPVISVDGAFGAPGLNLSHWPGNTTPPELKHDLSTGCALLFAALPDAVRRTLAGDAVAIVNNHYDTDGVCSAFATRYPERALPLADRLLAAAATGDFYQLPDNEALAVDAIVTAMADPDRSPIRADFRGLSDVERWELAQNALLDEMPALLTGDHARWRELWQPVVERAQRDVAALERAERHDDDALRLTTWLGRGADATFAPGRHALFGTSDAERALVLRPTTDGTLTRMILSTRAWFDLVTHVALPRPDLELLAARLNEREGTNADDALAWRAQPPRNAAPELWFGTRELDSFAEHSDALRPSALAAETLRREVERFLRADGSAPHVDPTSAQ